MPTPVIGSPVSSTFLDWQLAEDLIEYVVWLRNYCSFPFSSSLLQFLLWWDCARNTSITQLPLTPLLQAGINGTLCIQSCVSAMNIEQPQVDLSNIPLSQLREEINRRPGGHGYCPTCRGKWPIVMSCSRSWREEPHCYGCRKIVVECTCWYETT